jgi:hypothetical protein
MAIQISGNTVIDNSRKFIPVTIEAGGSTGSSGQVLQSTGTGVQWTTPAAGGGSGTFDNSFSDRRAPGAGAGSGNDIFTGPTSGYTFPATAGLRHVVDSILISNIHTNDLYLNTHHAISGGATVPLGNRLIVPYQGTLELLQQPLVVNPSDTLRFQALNGTTSSATGVNNALQSYLSISQRTDTNLFGTGALITSSEQIVYTAPAGATGSQGFGGAVIQSLRLCNYNLNVDIDASVSVYDTSATRVAYWVFNLTVPKNTAIEICDRPKHIRLSETIRVSASLSSALAVSISGKSIV